MPMSIHNALERTCKRNGVAFSADDASMVYERVPTWGPHADVPAGLAKVAKEIPLVILSNAMNAQIMSNVEKLGAPFHAVYTAEQAQAYKPRFKAFEYMFDMLGCGPEDILHCFVVFPLRPDVGPRSRHQEQGLGQSRPRAGQPVLRVQGNRGCDPAAGRFRGL